MSIQRVPVRITVWHEGVRLDMRAWLDDLAVDRALPPPYERAGGAPIQAYLSSPTTYTLTAHNSHDDPPWVFRKGKPVAA